MKNPFVKLLVYVVFGVFKTLLVLVMIAVTLIIFGLFLALAYLSALAGVG